MLRRIAIQGARTKYVSFPARTITSNERKYTFRKIGVRSYSCLPPSMYNPNHFVIMSFFNININHSLRSTKYKKSTTITKYIT